MKSYASRSPELSKEDSGYLDFLDYEEYSDDLHGTESDDTHIKIKNINQI